MNRFKLSAIVAGVVVLSGCTALPTVEKDEYRDNMPLMVGKPIAQKIAESQNKINDQFTLLERIGSNGYVGTYGVVAHNNNLDARKGSAYTLPQDYANNTYDIPSARGEKLKASPGVGYLANQQQVAIREVKQIQESSVLLQKDGEILVSKVEKSIVKDPVMSQELIDLPIPKDESLGRVVDNIDWKNNSLNELAKNLANASGYVLVTKGGDVNDLKINYTAKNKTIRQIIIDLERQVAADAAVVIIEDNKTFNIFYK